MAIMLSCPQVAGVMSEPPERSTRVKNDLEGSGATRIDSLQEDPVAEAVRENKTFEPAEEVVTLNEVFASISVSNACHICSEVPVVSIYE